MDGSDGAPITESRRKEFLERVKRRSATIGLRIPETIEIDGKSFALREFVVETKTQGAVPPEKRESVRTVRNTLKQERERRRKRLESAEISESEASELVRTILGLERALTALGNLSEPDFGARSTEAYVNKTKQWVDFVDQLTN
ncbi:DUF5788 family protein [Halodesulfurarchaeum sp.]|uniref:DUF5788 family protein n=1 Tax=Halodesulfurarchaeum sp. TaxID=1980530 RepID=UPI001BC33B30|nr:hypothetical protein [Halodesulfurarchaeum sp.]